MEDSPFHNAFDDISKYCNWWGKLSTSHLCLKVRLPLYVTCMQIYMRILVGLEERAS